MCSKKVSIITPCYNEEENVKELAYAVRNTMVGLPYTYEHILIDNHSTDQTWAVLKEIASQDKRIKVIRNVRNFGALRSLAYALFQMTGDVGIPLSCDMQDPPSLIPQFIAAWEQGYKVVLGKKTKADENALMYCIRGLYYKIIQHYASVPEYEQTTGFGLYDKEVVQQLESLQEPEPSLRHLIAELGYEVAFVEYRQPKRIHGKSKFNLLSYFEYALSTLINTSRAPLRLATLWGFTISLMSFSIAMVYFIWKLVNWMYFDLGQAPMLIGIFL